MATATTLRTRTPAAGSERSGPKTTRPSADKRTDLVLPAVAAKRCPHPTVYMLSDVGERDDAVGPYGKSLLYLVSNAFEGERAPSCAVA